MFLTYMLKDPSNPENEGKVFLFKYGKKIFDKLTAAMQPEFEDEEAIDPFDFWQGANFKLKARMLQDTETMTVLNLQHQVLYLMMMMQWKHWKKQFSLAEIVAPDQFKTYDELKTRLDYVLETRNPLHHSLKKRMLIVEKQKN